MSNQPVSLADAPETLRNIAHRLTYDALLHYMNQTMHGEKGQADLEAVQKKFGDDKDEDSNFLTALASTLEQLHQPGPSAEAFDSAGNRYLLDEKAQRFVRVAAPAANTCSNQGDTVTITLSRGDAQRTATLVNTSRLTCEGIQAELAARDAEVAAEYGESANHLKRIASVFDCALNNSTPERRE